MQIFTNMKPNRFLPLEEPTSLMVMSFIESINRTFGRYDNYTGGCYKFMVLLMQVFGGDAYFNGSHIITKIGDHYYDIDGIVTNIRGYLNVNEYYSYDELREMFLEYL